MVVVMVDTCFLIDYQRESKRGAPGSVVAFLRAHPGERLQISPVAWGEFLVGFEEENDPFIQFARDRLDLAPLLPEAASVYRRIYRHLKTAGALIGANDLWIASHAVASGLPLVTRNDNEFKRVPNIQLMTY